MLVRFNHALMSSNIGFILGLAGSVMNSCLGHQHVLNVHFGSRPKWTGKVQNTRIVFFSHPNPAYFSHPGMGLRLARLYAGRLPWLLGTCVFNPCCGYSRYLASARGVGAVICAIVWAGLCRDVACAHYPLKLAATGVEVPSLFQSPGRSLPEGDALRPRLWR